MTTFTAACRSFFGFLPGQNLRQFAEELKKLSHEDKMDIAQGLRDAGVECDDPSERAATA